MSKVIRGWRVRQEGPGYVVYFDPTIEHVVLLDGADEQALAPILQYGVHEGREASEPVLSQLPLFDE